MQATEPYKGGPGIRKGLDEKILRKFVLDIEASKAAADLGISRPTVNLRYRRYREAIYRSLYKAPRLSGTVEVDIQEFGGRGRKRLRALLAKYSRVVTQDKWKEMVKKIVRANKTRVLVFAERGERAKIYANIVKTKRGDDLLPLVRLVVKEGATIVSDMEGGLVRLKKEYKHVRFNNSIPYSERKKGHHTQNCDNFANFARARLGKFNGIHPASYPLHIKECLWRWSYRGLSPEKKRNEMEASLLRLLAKEI